MPEHRNDHVEAEAREHAPAGRKRGAHIMPLASQETINRVTNVLLNGTHQMKQAVLRSTPIAPPHGDVSMFTNAQLRGGAFGDKMKLTQVDDMIRFIKLGPVERDFVGALTFVTQTPAQLPSVASRLGWVPCWFLPWFSGKILKLKISDVATSPVINFAGLGIAPVANPSLFFTAGINGCSVFAIGAAATPSLYHGGVDPGSGVGMPLLANETTEAAWRRLLGRGATVKFVGSVGKSDYISELNPAATDDTDRLRYKTFKTTTLAQQLEQRLEVNPNLTKLTVIPWGAVFGLRDAAGHWGFTLVKHASATARKVTIITKKRLFRSDKVTRLERGEVRPSASVVRDAHGFVDLTDPGTVLAEQDHATCVCLGYSEFFPGAGAAVVRNLANTQIF
jgi:hypothetical protein